LDGNRRWAVQRGLSKLEGHRYGSEALKKIVPALIARGIAVASLYIFSTENWRRTQEEIGAIMDLIKDAFAQEFEEFKRQGVQVRIAGRIADFPEDIRNVFAETVEATKTNTKLIVNACLSYGGREEITRAAKALAAEAARNPASVETIDETAVQRKLYTADLPDVDLLIRTGGEQRLSGFLPWQSTYAELYFTPVYWPDFNEQELDKAIEEFGRRKRNFGA